MADTPIQPLIPVPRSGDVTRKKASTRKPRRHIERDKSKKQERQQKKGIIDTYA